MTHKKATLHRELTLIDLLIIGIGGAVGTGVLFGSAGMAAIAGPGVIFAWLIGGLMYLTVGLTYIDLNRLYPEEGGPSRYSLYTFGSITNMINAFCDILWYLFIPPIEALGVVEGLNFFYPHFINSSGNPTMFGAILGVVFMLLFFPFNYFGVKAFSKNTNWFGGIKLLLYLAVALGFLSVGHFVNFTAHGGLAPFGISGIFLAIPLGMFAFGSLRVIPDYSEEVKDTKVISKAILLSLLGQTLLYILFGAALVAGLNWHDVKITAGHWAGLTSIPGNPFLFMAGHSNLSWLVAIVVIIAIIGPFVTGYIYQGGASRILFAMGRSKILSKKMTELSKSHGIPVQSLVVTTVVGVLIAFIAAPAPSIYALLGDAVVAGYLGFAVNPPIMIALRKDGTQGYFRSPTVVNIIAALAMASASLIVYWSGWPSVPYAAILVLLLSIIFGFSGRANTHFVNSIWYISYIIFLSFMTYIGSEGALHLLNFTWGSIIVILVTVFIFLPWAVASRLSVEEQPKFVAPIA